MGSRSQHTLLVRLQLVRTSGTSGFKQQWVHVTIWFPLQRSWNFRSISIANANKAHDCTKFKQVSWAINPFSMRGTMTHIHKPQTWGWWLWHWVDPTLVEPHAHLQHYNVVNIQLYQIYAGVWNLELRIWSFPPAEMPQTNSFHANDPSRRHSLTCPTPRAQLPVQVLVITPKPAQPPMFWRTSSGLLPEFGALSSELHMTLYNTIQYKYIYIYIYIYIYL